HPAARGRRPPRVEPVCPLRPGVPALVRRRRGDLPRRRAVAPGARGVSGAAQARRRHRRLGRLQRRDRADPLAAVRPGAAARRPRDRAVARLRGRFDADAVELHDALTTTGEDIVAACNAMGLFGSGSRLIVVENVEAWKAPEAKAIAAYLKSPAPGTTVAFVGGELK